MTIWPFWWSWELEFIDHAEFSMSKRRVSETDIRLMMEDATDLSPDKEPGRWMVHTRHDGQAWAVIVEPVCRGPASDCGDGLPGQPGIMIP